MTQIDLINTVQEQTIGEELVCLFELYIDENASPPNIVYFYASFNSLDTVGGDYTSTDRDYQGEVEFKTKEDPAVANTYFPLPTEIDGIEVSSDGASNRPSITVANILDHFSYALGEFTNESLIGKKIKIRRTLRKYLLEPVGDTTLIDGLPVVEFPTSTFIIDRIASENFITITFELASPFDLANIKIPNRSVVGKYCSWVYQGLNLPTPRGGCPWKRNSIKTFDPNGSVSDAAYFFNSNDESLIPNVTISAYDGTEVKDDLVSVVNGSETEYYQALIDSAASPLTAPALWQRVRLYTTFDSKVGTTISANIRTDLYGGDHVIWHNNISNQDLQSPPASGDPVTIWRCVQQHTGSYEKQPKVGSPYWVKADVCSKTITGCKKRFQGKPAAGRQGSTSGTVPSVDTNSAIALPFGGFPGTAKFR